MFTTYGNFTYEIFKILSPNNCFIPFVCKILNTTFTIEVYDSSMQIVAQIDSKQIKHKVARLNNDNYVIYQGEPINCLELECDYHYLKIGNMISEPFSVSNKQLTKIIVSNDFSINSIPYNLGFKQYFYLEEPLSNPTVENLHIAEKDSFGTEKVTNTFVKNNYRLTLYEVPFFIQEFFTHTEFCQVQYDDCFTLIDFMRKSTRVKIEQDSSIRRRSKLEVLFPRKVVEAKYCEENTFALLNSIQSDGSCIEVEYPITVDTNCEPEEIIPIIIVY